MGLGVWEIGIVLIVALVVVGPQKLPELARSMGRGLRAFLKGLHDLTNDLESAAPPDSGAGPDKIGHTAAENRLEESESDRSG